MKNNKKKTLQLKKRMKAGRRRITNELADAMYYISRRRVSQTA